MHRFGQTHIQWVPRAKTADYHRKIQLDHQFQSYSSDPLKQTSMKDMLVKPFSKYQTQSSSQPLQNDLSKPIGSVDNAAGDSSSENIPKEFLFDLHPTNVDKTNKDESNRKCFGRLTNREKLAIILTFIFIVIICCVCILVPVLLLRPTNNSQVSSEARTIVSMCARTTCIGSETPFRSSMTTLSYSFDGNLLDSTGLAPGTPFGLPPSASFPATTINGEAYSLTSTLAQSASIPYINLSQRSFTIQIWIVVSFDGTNVDYPILSQCGFNDNICFFMGIRENRVFLSFDANNTNGKTLRGSTAVIYGVWNHISIVYDAIALQQLIYVNGEIDAVSQGIVQPYQGTSTGGSMTRIGFGSSSRYPSSYFFGFLDHLVISSGTARTACQILNDATLIVYFPFNADRQLLDVGYNNYNGFAANTRIMTNGRVKEALLFNTSTSYFQSLCFPGFRIHYIFTMAMWIYPINIGTGGTLVHFSALQNGTGSPCYDLLGLTSSGKLIMQFLNTANNTSSFEGPILKTNTWTHVAVIHNGVNGMRLLVNGEVVDSTRPSIYLPIITWNIVYITLANTNPQGPSYTLNCPLDTSSGYLGGPFAGAIDEFRLYNRELDLQEICVLANMS